MTIESTVATLGPGTFRSPLNLRQIDDAVDDGGFVVEGTRVRFDVEINPDHPDSDLLFEKAGARELLYFNPATVRAAIVTCGGLCPGLNNVIRSTVFALHHNYGVRQVYGIRYGYQGMNPAEGEPPMLLEAEQIDRIHQEGGSILGSSRGNQPPAVMVDFLVKHGINILFTVGGDGTQRGAHQIVEEIRRRGLTIAVAGIPKTIDNDIQYIRRTFGFTTAVDKAREVLTCAHTEAKGYPNGIGLVKLMGRDSGFIAAAAALASQDANFVLIPEIPLTLAGDNGFLAALQRRILDRKHALIAVAEGAGQNLFSGEKIKDASGNLLHQDIGLFLKDVISRHFKEQQIPLNLKYIDPSYIIRSVPANSEDAVLCDQFARNAVHAAMAGKTDFIVGFWNSFTLLPILMATAKRQQVQPNGFLWRSVISATGQPARWG